SSSRSDKFFHPLTEVGEKECMVNSMRMGEGTACSGTQRHTFQQTSELTRLFLRRKILEWSIAKYEAEMTLSKEEYKEFMLDLLAEKAHIANYLCSAYGMDPQRFWWNDPNYGQTVHHQETDDNMIITSGDKLCKTDNMTIISGDKLCTIRRLTTI
ncbi:hypothetical protein ACJMK2_015949, partial [Sinanodonta woodiana]